MINKPFYNRRYSEKKQNDVLVTHPIHHIKGARWRPYMYNTFFALEGIRYKASECLVIYTEIR